MGAYTDFNKWPAYAHQIKRRQPLIHSLRTCRVAIGIFQTAFCVLRWFGHGQDTGAAAKVQVYQHAIELVKDQQLPSPLSPGRLLVDNGSRQS